IELAVAVLTTGGFELATWTNYCNKAQLPVHPGSNTFRIDFEDLRLRPGRYHLGLALGSGRGFEDWLPDSVSFDIVPTAEAAEINVDLTNGVIIASANVHQLD